MPYQKHNHADVACNVPAKLVPVGIAGMVAITLLIIAIAFPVQAQDATEAPTATPVPPTPTFPPYPANDTGIYVTTQDFLNLRAGPSEYFEIRDVVAPETTLMAIGRTADTRWVQVVEPSGRRGWLFVRFLVYSGDVVTLSVDGVNPEPFIRQAGAVGVTTRETPIFDRVGIQVGTIPAGTRVELTGRLGSGSIARYQALYNDELFWIGSWNVRIVSGNTLRLFDTAYLYPYGRILRQLDEDLARTVNSLNSIETIWNTIAAGGAVNCNSVPSRVSRNVTDLDVRQEALFSPAVIALDEAVANTNAAIASFADACGRASVDDGAFVTRADVANARGSIEDARLNINIVQSMYAPLQRRDPLISLLAGTGGGPGVR
ncbi:MAG: SH3 domain-containing protein [Chloroflexota bacterium]